jgi:anti-anti-sigma factor
MLKHLKMFAVEKVGRIVIVLPQGDANSFRYHDLHREANSVRDILMKPESEHLILELGGLSYFGSEFIGALVSMAREVRHRGGKAVICNATEQMQEVLRNMSLFKLWPYYDTRQEAIDALNAAHDSPSTV